MLRFRPPPYGHENGGAGSATQLNLRSPVVRQERLDFREEADVNKLLFDALRRRALDRLDHFIQEQLGEQPARSAQLLAKSVGAERLLQMLTDARGELLG